MYCSVRSAIIKNEANRNKYYFIKLKNLIQRLPPDHPDIATLYEIMESPLQKQHRYYELCQKKDVFDEPQVNDYMRSLRPVIPIFYDFVFPENIRRANMRLREKRQLRKQQETSTMTTAYRDAIVEHAYQCVMTPVISSKQDFWNLVVALQLMSGRRTNEIVIHLEWDVVENFPYQLLVSGISKKFDNTEVYTIPLLVPAADFIHAMELIRNYKYDGDTPFQFLDETTQHSEMCMASSNRHKWFGFRVIHSEIRSIYAEEAYKSRQINEFEPTASVALFKSRALSLPDPVYTPLTAYTRINFMTT